MSVAVPALLIVVGMAVVAWEIVAAQLRQAAADSARKNVEAIARGYVDPISAATQTIVEAGASDAATFLTPGPGTHTFVRTIHMGMSGTLTVE